MLTVRTLAAAEGVAVSAVACRGEPVRGAVEQAADHALVFVRRGSFSRLHRGRRIVIDPTRCYTLAPGDEHRYDHGHGRDDDCTYVTLTPRLVADATGGADRLPTGAFLTTPDTHLAQRTLLSDIRRGETDALLDDVLALLAAAFPGCRSSPARQPATARRHAALVEQARDRLAVDASLSLTELAAAVDVSPHHLSRLFRTWTGLSVSRYRMRLRARAALERIAEGERDLAALAADLGLADQSHLNRLLRAEMNRSPTRLRQELLG